jgi:osmotically-inducible protein OsmY
VEPKNKASEKDKDQKKRSRSVPFHNQLYQGGLIAMKNRNIVINCLMLLMLITALVGCASTPTHESAGEYVDDSVITTKIKTLIAEDDFLKSFQISVETYQGTVQLSGFVNSQMAADKAGQIATSVHGVKSIKNNLIVK